MPSHTWTDVFDLYRQYGDLQYAGEPVTQLAHAWQCYALARQQGAGRDLQLAAFFHDLGHLFQRGEGSPTALGIDDRHEAIGASYLRPLCPESVYAPIALHVDAKRYLVSAEPSYAAQLSEDSVRSLALQGGPMHAEEIAEFLSRPWAEEAIALRRWDELAKEAGRPMPSAVDVLSAIQALLEAGTP